LNIGLQEARYMVAKLIEITGTQCRMARAAVGMGVRELAEKATVSTNTITRFERGDSLYSRTTEAIRSALEAAGVEFIPENGAGAGVRLKKGAAPPE
jgi:transcriptional regulator with XRE-family HTH domain